MIAEKRLLVLGGTSHNCEIIRKAKRLGAWVAVSDYNKPDRSPGKMIADADFPVSATDEESIARLIEKERIDGVLTGFNDALLLPYARICQMTEKPCYGTTRQFELFTNKKYYQKTLAKYDIPVVSDYIVQFATENETPTGLSYPLLIKPGDNSGGRGISVCHTPEDLKHGFVKALAHTNTASVLVQPYIKGEEITVFWFFQRGKAYLSAVGNRHMEKNAADRLPLPVGYTYPSKYTVLVESSLLRKCSQMFNDYNIREGMMFMQCFVVNESDLYVYDIGFRLTATYEYKIFAKLCGYDPLERMIEYALTGTSGASVADEIDPCLSGKHGFNVSFLMRPGTIAKMDGIDEIRRIPDVIDALSDYEIGDSLLSHEEGLLKQICLRVIGASATVAEMKASIDKIHSAFSLTGANNENLLLELLDTSCIKHYVL